MKKERLIKSIIVGILMVITCWFGFRPVIKGNVFQRYIKMSRKDLNFNEFEYATIVIGSEPEGIALLWPVPEPVLKLFLSPGTQVLVDT